MSNLIARKLWALSLLFGVVASGGVPPTSAAPNAPGDEPAKYLVIENVLDGKCQILSAGGKLSILRNTHQSRDIRYRLTRYFANKPQGMSVGIVAPGDEGQKLGCDKVDGRSQLWKIERAQFINE